MDERELNGMKSEMEKLSEVLEDLGDELETEVVASILRLLALGHTAESIVEEYGLIDPSV